MLHIRMIGQTSCAACTSGWLQCQLLGTVDCLASLQVRMYGGAASADITTSTTHVVVVSAADSSTPEAETRQPEQLLGQLLREHGGLPALKTLHRRLHSQQAHVVTQR